MWRQKHVVVLYYTVLGVTVSRAFSPPDAIQMMIAARINRLSNSNGNNSCRPSGESTTLFMTWDPSGRPPESSSDANRKLAEALGVDPSSFQEMGQSPSLENSAPENTFPPDDMPVQSAQGLYQIETKAQHAALLAANPDKLVVIKFYATYCRACATMAPQFLGVKRDPQLQKLPIVWAEFKASSDNKGFFRRLDVLSLPTVHFYDGSNGLVENFPCGPSKVSTLKRKLASFLNTRVDPQTLQLKQVPVESSKDNWQADAPSRERVVIGDELITQEHIDYLRDGLSFFEELTDDEFNQVLGKARLLTFLPGDVIIRQGLPGQSFFVIKSGLAEMMIRNRFEDPISTPSAYLGAVVNQLGKFDYFGERALSTGEPYAASVRAVEKTRCFIFNVDEIPESSILSKKRRANRDMVDKLTERYVLPEDYVPPTYPTTARDDGVLELLVRFKQIRQAAKCFEYIMNSETLLGDKGSIARRSLLVTKLSLSQRQDFIDVFNMMDVDKTGTISLLEMRRFMESARKDVSDRELLEMINKANPATAESWNMTTGLSLDEFLGVMAEAEFYSLFTETFQELDKGNTGYVRAGDLDEVLDGVRDLISDDRKSIIDVEDKEFQVDYEQFARMLLGAAL